MDWTVRQVVQWATQDFERRGLDSPRLDAELLVSEALSLSRVGLYMDLDRPLSDPEREAIRELVKRRRAREPIAYILGTREFYGRPFEVGPAVLIPRPDTETLVERALCALEGDAPARVLDLCTGSGAIGLTLAAERPGWTVDLTDVSAAALGVARRNAEVLGVAERVRFFEGDLFDCVPADMTGAYDLVVANPPYIAPAELSELAPEVRDHEPHLALLADDEGFAVHARIAAGVERFLSPRGVVLIEVGAGQAAQLAARFAAHAWVKATRVHADLGGIDRVVEARREPEAPPAEGEVVLERDPEPWLQVEDE